MQTEPQPISPLSNKTKTMLYAILGAVEIHDIKLIKWLHTSQNELYSAALHTQLQMDTCLSKTIKDQNKEMAYLLINTGAPLRNPSTGPDGKPELPLVTAIRHGQIDIANWIIHSNINLSPRDHTTTHPLLFATYKRDHNLIKAILQANCPIACTSFLSLKNPIYWLSEHHNLLNPFLVHPPLHKEQDHHCQRDKMILKDLIRSGIEPNPEDIRGHSPFYFSLSSNECMLEIASLLLDTGIIPSANTRQLIKEINFTNINHGPTQRTINRLLSRIKNPPKLKETCRRTIRTTLRTTFNQDLRKLNRDQLHLPPLLFSYTLLEN